VATRMIARAHRRYASPPGRLLQAQYQDDPRRLLQAHDRFEPPPNQNVTPGTLGSPDRATRHGRPSGLEREKRRFHEGGVSPQMTGTVGLNDTTTATSSATHASTAHGHGDPTPPREAAPPVVRAGASRSDRTIAVHTGVRMLSQSSCLDQNALRAHRRAQCAPVSGRGAFLTSYDPNPAYFVQSEVDAGLLWPVRGQ